MNCLVHQGANNIAGLHVMLMRNFQFEILISIPSNKGDFVIIKSVHLSSKSIDCWKPKTPIITIQNSLVRRALATPYTS